MDLSFPFVSVHLLVPKDFTIKKQSYLISIPQFPQHWWTNLGTSFRKCNSNIFLRFISGSANLFELPPWFCTFADRQVFYSTGLEILKQILSSLWSLCWSTKTWGASLTRDLGVKFGLHPAFLGLSNSSENKGLNCWNFVMWFWRALSSQLCQPVRVRKLLYICWSVYTVNMWYCKKLKTFSNEK